MRYLGGHLGLLERSTQQFLQSGDVGMTSIEIEALIGERAQAKKNKDFTRSDAIRQELLAKGIVLEDQAGGMTTWRKD